MIAYHTPAFVNTHEFQVGLVLAVVCMVGGGCQRSSDTPLLIEKTINQLKASGWSLIESSQAGRGKTEYWLRLTRAPNGTNVDLYVTSNKPPAQQYVQSFSINVWSQSRTSPIAINKSISTAITRLATVVPKISSLVKSAQQSRRQEMNEGIPYPIRWVGRSGTRSGWKAEVVEYTDHLPGDVSRQQFALLLRFDS